MYEDEDIACIVKPLALQHRRGRMLSTHTPAESTSARTSIIYAHTLGRHALERHAAVH